MWGDILQEYSEISGNRAILNKIELQKDIMSLTNVYQYTMGCIGYLRCIAPPKGYSLERVEDLRKLGYKVDLTNSERYASSLHAAEKKAQNVKTQIRMKTNELKGEKAEKGVSFDAIIAMVSSELKMQIPDEITVSRYCEYKKIIDRKIKAATAKNGTR